MPLIINLVDIPSEGLPFKCEVQASEIALPSDDGKIPGFINCTGQVFVTDDHLANFQGTLRGKVTRECVRCLMSFEEDVCLPCNVQFSQSSQSSVVPVSSKKMKKGSRMHDSALDDEHEKEIDTYPIMDNQIDLLPALREHLILSTPLQPLCHESCAGLCQVCGANINEGVCGCCSPVTDLSAFVRPMLNQKTTKHSSRPV